MVPYFPVNLQQTHNARRNADDGLSFRPGSVVAGNASR
jgi:hypothetical protein